MRSAILSATLAAMMIAVAVPVEATGGSQTFRVLTAGDFYMVGLSSSCPNTYAGPVVDPSNPDPIDMVLDAIPGTCWILKTNLGYDGATGASSTQTTDHVNHAFNCAVTSSATGIVGNLLPWPANVAIADSISVGFDLDGNTIVDTSYGGHFQRRSITSEVVPRVQSAATNGDAGTLASTPQWYLDGLNVAGATPNVSGNVDGPRIVIFNQSGSDVTIDCTF